MIPYTFDMAVLAPEIFLSVTAMGLLLLGVFFGNRATRLILVLSVLALFVSVLELTSEAGLWARTFAFHGLFVTDLFAVTLKVFCCIGMAMALMMAAGPLRQDGMERFEYPVLVLISGVGMMVMLSSSHFLTLYMGLELSSLSLYVLAAFRRETALSAEAGMKYFILGALSSGMLLFGISLIYGFTGHLGFADVRAALESNPDMAGVAIGMVFVMAAIAFKISAVPFHMWTPDVYHGAPAPVTAFFAMVPKLAAVGVLIRLVTGPFAPISEHVLPILLFMAVASMIWGAVAAIPQTNIKRLMAYASIGNIGYALLGLVAGTPAGLSATILYMGIYLMMTAGTFAILLAVRRQGQQAEDISDLAGLSRTHPVLAYALSAFLFSMAGIPPLAGFFGKLVVFQALVDAGFYGVAILGVIASVIAAFYYINIIRVMFFEPVADEIEVRANGGQDLVILASILFVLAFALMPQKFYTVAAWAGSSLTVTAPVVAGPVSAG